MPDSLNLTGVLDQLDEQADGEELTLGSILEALGDRGYGPLLLAAALIEILPTGAIPGVPSIVALTVIIFAGQMVAGRSSPWLPGKLRRRGFSKSKFEKAREKVRKVTRKMDRAIKPRMAPLVTPFAAKIVGVVCILLAATMPPLELLPFASSVPAAAIALFGVGLSARDGLLVLIGLIVSLVTPGILIYWLVF